MSHLPETQKSALLAAAAQIRAHAHAPYSQFQVGAALLAADGLIYTGVNVENASFGLTVCAERNAIGQMVTAGQTTIHALAVCTSNGVSPCGACRQVIAEFATPDTPVWISDTSGNIRLTTVGQLLPDGFGPDQLPPTA
ncbi:MAG TPA: cytidine deaminase [Anaerolineae bacterium]|nr:cytidine deaminase [Anaerolineae bacterium]